MAVSEVKRPLDQKMEAKVPEVEAKDAATEEPAETDEIGTDEQEDSE